MACYLTQNNTPTPFTMRVVGLGCAVTAVPLAVVETIAAPFLALSALLTQGRHEFLVNAATYSAAALPLTLFNVPVGLFRAIYPRAALPNIEHQQGPLTSWGWRDLDDEAGIKTLLGAWIITVLSVVDVALGIVGLVGVIATAGCIPWIRESTFVSLASLGYSVNKTNAIFYSLLFDVATLCTLEWVDTE